MIQSRFPWSKDLTTSRGASPFAYAKAEGDLRASAAVKEHLCALNPGFGQVSFHLRMEE